MKMKLRIALTLIVIVEVITLYRIFKPETPEPEPPVSLEETPEGFDFASKCGVTPPEEFSELLREVAEEYKIDPRILAVTVYRESKCDQWALGGAGEIGLAQIMPKVWTGKLKGAGIIKRSQELWDPRNNLRASAWIFKNLHKQTEGNIFSMFRRYNGSGPKARKYASEQKHALAEL
jgi:hypothetical protein